MLIVWKKVGTKLRHKIMKPVIYARVSYSTQETSNQIRQLVSWSESRDWGTPPVYEETESAWKAGHQRVLAGLLEDARKHKFDTLIVWALDRLSREGSLAILSLIHRLKTFGVKVISYQETWTEAPGELAEVLYAIAGWVAKMESQRRSERTKAGLERVRATGKRLGRPKGARDKRKRKRRRNSSPNN
jgi:DNA invertase Pin-like site-specific DNA recombinase